MSAVDMRSAKRPDPDQPLVDIAEYVKAYEIDSATAYETARYCLMDTLACGFQALDYPACTKLLGPVVQGATMAGGSRVPGTSWELDPIQGASDLVPTASQDLPADASDLMRQYAEAMPVVMQAWWEKVR